MPSRSTSWSCKKKKLVSYTIKRDVLSSKCFLCGQALQRPSLDHVVPVSRGGDNNWGNILWACLSCNTRKCARKARPCELFLLSVVNDIAVTKDSRIALNGLWVERKHEWLYKKSWAYVIRYRYIKTWISPLKRLVKAVSTMMKQTYCANAQNYWDSFVYSQLVPR